ncbi:MAG: FIST C-terminal domain-containing protein [Hyphomonadaceae bacterium]|nr:FIST C-terminal domain-containing protein [Hyphomonadaceae bacterium]
MQTVLMRWRDEAGAFDCETHSNADFVLYFGPNATISDDRFQSALRTLYPGARIVGCTTGTAICGIDLCDDAAFALACSLDHGTVKLAQSDISRESSHDAGAALARDLDGPDLAGVLLFCDSLNVDGIALLEGVRSRLPNGVVIAGGLASDGSAFERTIVGADCAPRERFVAALGLYGAGMVINQGCAHGWDVFGPPRRITKAAGLELFELDGKPALDLYERYLGPDAAELPAAALRFPLLIENPDNASEQVVRTVLDVDYQKRSMTFASPIPEGWSARLMRGAIDHLTEGARVAAGQAAGRSLNNDGGLALLISCVGRRVVMGQETADEVEAVSSQFFSGLLQAGFYSHGEISTSSSDQRCGLHNQTMTVVTIQEAA